jgi:hypothetical protein
MRGEELNQLALEMAIDGAWCVIKCHSVSEIDGNIQWMNVTDDLERLSDEFKLLCELRLAEIHPDHPAWIREIAEL